MGLQPTLSYEVICTQITCTVVCMTLLGLHCDKCYLFVTVHCMEICLANAYTCINYLQLHCRYIHYYYHYIHYLYIHSHWNYHWKLLRMLVCFCQYTVQLPTVGG